MRLARMCRKAFNLLIGMLAVAAVFFGCGNQNPTTETYHLAVGTLVPSVTELAPTAVWPSVTPTAMRAEPTPTAMRAEPTPTAMRAEPTPTGVTGPSATVTAIPGSIPVGHEPVQAQTATVAQTVIPSSAENDTYSAWPDHTVTPTVSLHFGPCGPFRDLNCASYTHAEHTGKPHPTNHILSFTSRCLPDPDLHISTGTDAKIQPEGEWDSRGARGSTSPRGTSKRARFRDLNPGV